MDNFGTIFSHLLANPESILNNPLITPEDDMTIVFISGTTGLLSKMLMLCTNVSVNILFYRRHTELPVSFLDYSFYSQLSSLNQGHRPALINMI